MWVFSLLLEIIPSPGGFSLVTLVFASLKLASSKFPFGKENA